MSNNEKIIINARRNASDSSDKKIERTTAFSKVCFLFFYFKLVIFLILYCLF